MGLRRKLGIIHKLLWSTNKRQTFKLFNELRKEHGFKFAVVTLKNRAKGVRILPGEEPGEFLPKYSSVELDQYGNEIFKKEQEELSIDDKKKIMDHFEMKPTISILMPIYNPKIKWLKIALDSLINQEYPHWELIAVDDCSKKRGHFKVFKKYCKKDNRIKFFKKDKNEGISLTTNYAFNKASSDYIGLMDQDDEITKDALFFMVSAINKNPDADWYYSNECKALAKKKPELFHFYFKPDFDPILLTSHMYTSHFTIYRKSIMLQAGLFRKEFDFSQDYDLALRIAKIAKKVIHVDRVLYFWRAIPSSGGAGGKDFARIANMKASEEYINSLGVKGKTIDAPTMNYFKTDNPTGLVSIIIPTDNVDYLIRAIEGIIHKTDYKDYEIIPVTNSKVAKEIKEKYKDLDCLNICIYDEPFQFSRKCNCGAKIAKGQYVLFYNDDVYPFKSDWLNRMMDYIAIPYVGSVSPMCQFENGQIQYAGMITGAPGLITTSFIDTPANMPFGYPFNHMLARSVSVMSGACCLCKKELFDKVGGFDEINTPNGHSDVLLSFKFIEKGYHNVFNPYARVVHIGNHSWHAKDKKDKCDIHLLKKWDSYIKRDPYFTNNQFKGYSTIFREDNFAIYAPKKLVNEDSKKDILFVTHELSRSGAPLYIIEHIKLCIKLGYFPVLLSYEDGPLRQDILDLGVNVIIDSSPKVDTMMFKRFARNFDIVFCNTIATAKAAECLSGDLPEVILWVHEGKGGIETYHLKMPKRFKSMDNMHIYAVSNLSKDVTSFYYPQYKCEVAGLGLKPLTIEKALDDKVINYLIVGPIERRKGYQFFIKMINRLDNETKKKVHFTIVAYKMSDEKLGNELFKLAKKNPGLITIKRGMPKERLLEQYAKTDYGLIPSIEESLSLVAIEEMSAGIPFIITKECGAVEYLPDELKKKLVYQANDIDAFVDLIKKSANKNYISKDEIKELQDIYNNHYSYRTFENTWTLIYNGLDE